MRKRDSSGKFKISETRSEYGGFLTCTLCSVEKECNSENFRMNTAGGYRKVSLVCRECRSAEQKANHAARKEDPEYCAAKKARSAKYRAANRDKGLLRNYQMLDKKKGIDCDLSLEFVQCLISLPCYYCGETERIGLDRIDNSKGHMKNNVVPCCPECNKARSNFFTQEEMKNEIGPAIRRVREARKRREGL